MTLSVGPTEDLAACLALRHAVFVEEQGVPVAVERDGRDDAALHILARCDGRPVGAARVLVAEGRGKIGRVCVLRAWRGQGIGTALVQACLDRLRDMPSVARAELGAQTHALSLYARLGFRAFGPVFEDAGGQPHRMMGCDL